MRPLVVALLLAFVSPTFSAAADRVDVLFGKALEQVVRYGYEGDTSSAERYLQAVLEQDPDHLDAQWQLIIPTLPSRNVPLTDRSSALAAVGPAFARLAKRAKETKRVAFLHYATSIYASRYGAYPRSLSEIEQAINFEPNSARYLFAVGKLLVEHGYYTKQDGEIEKGISVIRKAKELAKKYPNRFARDGTYDFELASAISKLRNPRWHEVVDHYLRFIEHSEESVVYAFAWDNLSIAYRELRDCEKAKAAAERASRVTRFGAAQWNKRFAEFCLELQKMGLTAVAETKRD